MKAIPLPNPPIQQVYLHQRNSLLPQKPILVFDLEETIDAVFLNSFADESNEMFFEYAPQPNDLISLELANVHRTEHSTEQGHTKHNFLELVQESKANENHR